MPAYGYALGSEAVYAFTVLPVRQREKLLRTLDSLARFPTQTGDYQEAGAWTDQEVEKYRSAAHLVCGPCREGNPHCPDRVHYLRLGRHTLLTESTYLSHRANRFLGSACVTILPSTMARSPRANPANNFECFGFDFISVVF